MNAMMSDTKLRMRKSIDSFKEYLDSLRTNVAQPSMLAGIMVECYGTEMPINQLAYITTGGARVLMVTPFDKKTVSIIEKAIRNAGLGVNPSTSGDAIRVPLPPLSEENRELLRKKARDAAEQARVSIRQLRREMNEILRKQQKAKEITEDEERRFMEEVQKLTNEYSAEVDKLLLKKEEGLMEV